MNHKQALSDFKALQKIAGGLPYDSSEVFEGVAAEMLQTPTVKEATKHICLIIDHYFTRGGPDGDSLTDNEKAAEIFIRHGLL